MYRTGLRTSDHGWWVKTAHWTGKQWGTGSSFAMHRQGIEWTLETPLYCLPKDESQPNGENADNTERCCEQNVIITTDSRDESASVCELVTKTEPFFLNKSLETLQGTIVGIQHHGWQWARLSCSVPAVGAVNQDTSTRCYLLKMEWQLCRCWRAADMRATDILSGNEQARDSETLK